MERGVIPGQEPEEFQLLPPAAPPAGPEVGQGLAGPAEVAAASGVTCQAAPAAARANHYFLLGRVKWDLGCSYLLVGSGWVYTEVAEGCSRSATAINLLANIFLRAAEPIRSRLLFHSDNPTHIHVLIVRGFPSCHHWTSKCAHTFTRARPPSTQIHSHIHTLLARLPRYSTLSSSSR